MPNRGGSRGWVTKEITGNKIDIRDGQIYTGEELQEQRKIWEEFVAGISSIKEMKISPTEVQMARKPPKIGRNEPCGCGSGKEFKKCCYLKQGKE